MRAARVLLVLVVVLGVALVAPVPSVSAASLGDDEGGSSSGASVGDSGPGGVPITVTVSFSTAAGGGSAGGGAVSSTVEATVLPACGYSRGLTGASLARFLTAPLTAVTAGYTGQSLADWQEPYPGFEAYASDEEGYWFMPRCWRDRASDMDDAAYRDMERAFLEANGPVYVPAGSEPPVGVVDGRTLAQAAWDAVVIPSPEVGYNPSLGESGYTLVGWYTWVWASGQTPARVTATATAGPVSATVTAVADGLDLSGPDAQVECSGFGVAWSEGASGTDCAVVFTRSSAHLGGTTPLSVSASYEVSYTATDGAAGDLGAATTTSTVSIPVAEVQTLNTNEH